MKIWHAIDSLEVGGAETMVATLCREQQKAGLAPSVHCLLRGGKIAGDLKACGIPVYVHGPGALLEVARRMFRMMRTEHPDVLHCHNETPTIFGAPAARAAGVRCVISTYHGMVVPLEALRLKFWMATRFCNRVVAVSGTTRANLEKSPLSCPGRIVTLYNSAAPPGCSSAFSVCAPGEFAVVNVARHVPAKDLVTLLRASAMVRAKAPDVVLVLAGDGPLTGSLKQAAAELELNDSVRFLGEQPDVGGILRQCRLFALSSVNEGLPISLLEAMSAGLPQVVTAVGGMREIVELSQSGVIVPPQDPAALAQAILRFHDDEAWRLECAQRARDCYESRFTPPRMAADYYALYAA
jgi:glycosyltransferase involved in cell wall biosynthesis